MRITEPDVKVKCTKETIIYFNNYLTHCEVLQVVDSYTSPFFKSLFKHSLQTIAEKLMKLIFKNAYERADKKMILKLNHAERIAMSILFFRVPIPPELQYMETQILNQLILE